MSKLLVLRIYQQTVKALYSDGMEIEDLEKIRKWAQARISDIRAMYPQEKSK